MEMLVKMYALGFQVRCIITTIKFILSPETIEICSINNQLKVKLIIIDRKLMENKSNHARIFKPFSYIFDIDIHSIIQSRFNLTTIFFHMLLDERLKIQINEKTKTTTK